MECSDKIKVTNVILVKKGMAEKAFINNMREGNTKKIEAQIKKGTVKIVNNND